MHTPPPPLTPAPNARAWFLRRAGYRLERTRPVGRTDRCTLRSGIARRQRVRVPAHNANQQDAERAGSALAPACCAAPGGSRRSRPSPVHGGGVHVVFVRMCVCVCARTRARARALLRFPMVGTLVPLLGGEGNRPSIPPPPPLSDPSPCGICCVVAPGPRRRWCGPVLSAPRPPWPALLRVCVRGASDGFGFVGNQVMIQAATRSTRRSAWRWACRRCRRRRWARWCRTSLARSLWLADGVRPALRRLGCRRRSGASGDAAGEDGGRISGRGGGLPAGHDVPALHGPVARRPAERGRARRVLPRGAARRVPLRGRGAASPGWSTGRAASCGPRQGGGDDDGRRVVRARRGW